MEDELSRRHLLGLSAAGTIAIAGCADLDVTESDGETNAESTAEAGTADETDGNETDGADDDEDDSDAEIHEDYETTEVRAVTPDGEELGSVTAAIADTDERLVRGLSETEELPDDRGMLFVFEEEDQRQFVMRDMDFGIDIVYAESDGTITGLHHAPAPREHEDGSKQVYVGHGQYVLEVNYEWTIEHDVAPGDVLEFELDG